MDNNGNVLTYDGSTWSSPDNISGGHDLSSVSCATASYCAAVSDENGNVLIYDGSSWSSQHNVDSSGGGVDSISCPTASFCVAVDDSGNALTYNGASWSSANRIDMGTYGLQSVSCPTATFCAAVSPSEAYTYPSVPATTLTVVTSVTSTPVVGQSVSIGVQVTGPNTNLGALTPSGQVTVSDGTKSCVGMLAGSNGTGTTSCPLVEQVAGNYTITASYSGDVNFSSSATASATVLTIARATSTTAFRISTARVTYGNEVSEHLSVSVSPEFPGSTPAGTVVVGNSKVSLCTITLLAGAGSCVLSPRSLAVGIYRIVADYGGSLDFTTSASVTRTLTVAKETSRTVLKISAHNVTYGHEGTEHLSITVSPEFKGSTPTGRVTVKASSTTLCALILSAGRGSCNLSRKQLAVGTYSLIATYGGSSYFDTSASVKESLKVAK